jgi:hypothetical protein
MHVFNSKYAQFATQYNIVHPLSNNIINPAGVDTTVDNNNQNETAAEILPAGLDQYFPQAASLNKIQPQLSQ